MTIEFLIGITSTLLDSSICTDLPFWLYLRYVRRLVSWWLVLEPLVFARLCGAWLLESKRRRLRWQPLDFILSFGKEFDDTISALYSSPDSSVELLEESRRSPSRARDDSELDHGRDGIKYKHSYESDMLLDWDCAITLTFLYTRATIGTPSNCCDLHIAPPGVSKPHKYSR